MKKKFLCIIATAALLTATISACTYVSPNKLSDTTEQSEEYVYFSSETQEASESETQQTEAATTKATEESTSEAPSEQGSTAEYTLEITTEPPTTEPPAQETSNGEITQVDLSISMPEANGKMHVDNSSGNKYIVAVVNETKADPALLCAVFSLPESGQNYVFEFYSAKGRSVDDLRRVYLLDKDCKIVYVAATNNSERKNLSTTENWFSMNVLIKKVIFPAVADQF